MGRTARQGRRWGLEVMSAPRKGVGPFLGSPFGLSCCLGQGQLTEDPQTCHPTSPGPDGALAVP